MVQAISSELQAEEKLGPGGLLLVVGPSGSGKDTLLRQAATLLRGNNDIRFPRRLITRPSDPESENSIEITPIEFDRLKETGTCTFSWQAHGLGYAIPATALDDVRAGKTVVFNSSRTIIAEATARFQHVRVAQIDVPQGLLAERLARRGRETTSDIEQRLQRSAGMVIDHHDLCVIVNDQSASVGGQRLADEITAFHQRRFERVSSQ